MLIDGANIHPDLSEIVDYQISDFSQIDSRCDLTREYLKKFGRNKNERFILVYDEGAGC
jgi:hypothetical protein